MIYGKNVIKITDFGIAHIMNVDKSFDFENPDQEEDYIPGTPLSMSPEQIMAKDLDNVVCFIENKYTNSKPKTVFCFCFIILF